MAKRTDGKGSTIPFSQEDFRYRADEFLTSGHDDHGQSVRLFFRCPPALERSLEVIRDSRRFPYATVTDIIRHAVIRHAEWLHRMEPDMPRHFLSGLTAINEICRDAEMLNAMQGTFAKVDALIESYLAKGDIVEAQRLLSTTRGQLSKLPDSRWKREFSERFTRKYARHLSTGLPAAPTTSGGDSEAGKVLAFPAFNSSAGTSSDTGDELEGPGHPGTYDEDD